MSSKKPSKRTLPARRSQITKSSESPGPLAEVLARDPRTLSVGLQRLARALAQAQPGSPAVLTHGDFEAMIEFYLDSEREGQDAPALYPAMWRHIQTCRRCRRSYELLSKALREEHFSDVAAPETPMWPTLPFLKATNKEGPWARKNSLSIGNGPMSFVFMIRAKYLQGYSNPKASMTRRDGLEPPPQEKPFLTDVFSIGEQEIDVTMWLKQSDQPDHLRIVVEIVTSEPLAEPVNVLLTWNDLHLSGRLEQGRAILDGIPLPVPLSEADIQIAFEQVDNASTSEEDDGHPQ